MAPLLVLCLFVMIAYAKSTPLCVFNDLAGSQQQLDLRALMDKQLEQTDDLTPPNIYQFTPCKDGIDLALCAPHTAMAVKLRSYPEAQCFILANWNMIGQKTLPFYDDTFKRWTFNYSTGSNCNGSSFTFLAYFSCDENIADFVVLSAGTPKACTAEMFISTQYACAGTIYSTQTPNNSDNALSGGSIFVIMVFVGLFVYFVIGYIICAISNLKHHGFCDINANIPNRDFWNMLPLFVFTGCIFTRDFLYGLLCQSADNQDHLIRYDDENINPFAKTS